MVWFVRSRDPNLCYPGFKPREYKVSDGIQHLGSSLNEMSKRQVPNLTMMNCKSVGIVCY